MDSLLMAEHARPLISLLKPQFLFIKRLSASLFSVLISWTESKSLLWKQCEGIRRGSWVHQKGRSRNSRHQSIPENSLCPNGLPSLGPHDNSHVNWWWNFYLTISTVMELTTPHDFPLQLRKALNIKIFFLNWPEICSPATPTIN